MILILGYGNPLRTDDAIGQHVAWGLLQRFERSEVVVRIAHQLTPELAEIISHFDRVVFIDARVGDTPGMVVHEQVHPISGAGAFTHHVSPATLLGEAGELYGRTVRGILISVVGRQFDYGTDLSPQLLRLLPDIVDRAAGIVRQYMDIQPREENHFA